MANGMTALVVAIAVASSAAPAGTAGPAPEGSSWEARNRERARAGLLPRKLPPPRSRLATVAAGAPTAVPSTGAAIAAPAQSAAAIPTAAAVPTATATVIPLATAPATPIPIPPATAPATPVLATAPVAAPAAAPAAIPIPPAPPALATATPAALAPPAAPRPPSPAANPLQVSLVPTSPARLVSATADVRGDVAAPRVDSVLVTRMGDMRLVVTRPSAAPAAAQTAPLARPQHPPGLLSRSWTAAGEQVHRVVDPDGRISERRVDTRGLVVEARVVGDATVLPLVWQKRRVDGNVVQVVQDAASGALIALTRDGGGHLVDARVQPRDGIEG